MDTYLQVYTKCQTLLLRSVGFSICNSTVVRWSLSERTTLLADVESTLHNNHWGRFKEVINRLGSDMIEALQIPHQHHAIYASRLQPFIYLHLAQILDYDVCPPLHIVFVYEIRPPVLYSSTMWL